MSKANTTDILVEASPGATRGLLHFQGRTYPCALGRSGISTEKREGDGATPVGTFPLRELHFRADRLTAPQSVFSPQELRPEDGWCDAPGDPAYNRPVTLPYAASHENLWREDHLYDVVIMLGYNDDPVVPERGSAIFLHIGHEDLPPTEGCVAMRRTDLLQILSSATARARVCVLAD